MANVGQVLLLHDRYQFVEGHTKIDVHMNSKLALNLCDTMAISHISETIDVPDICISTTQAELWVTLHGDLLGIWR